MKMEQGSDFEFIQCSNPACSFRFPIQLSTSKPGNFPCPVCKGATFPSICSLPQVYHPERTSPENTDKVILEALLDNIRSAFNVGSMFRTSDGCGISHLYLCGTTSTPLNLKVKKTALGAENSVNWSYHLNALQILDKLIGDGREVWAIEDGIYSEPIDKFFCEYSKPVIIVVGNELAGIDPAIIDLCTRKLSIPMSGIKRSLNVEVAFSIAAYFVKSILQVSGKQNF